MFDDIFTTKIIKFNTLYICYKIPLLGRIEKERRGRIKRDEE
jgi:hypothetical protein